MYMWMFLIKLRILFFKSFRVLYEWFFLYVFDVNVFWICVRVLFLGFEDLLFCVGVC